MLETVIWSVGVGAATSFVRWSLRKSFDSIFGERKWYKRLGEVKRQRLTGALTVAAHHLIVVGGMTYVLKTRNQALYRTFLLMEFGFDISDTFLALTSASMTGMSRLPVLMHHSVAMLFSSFALSQRSLLSWQTGANVAYYLLLAGAFDTVALRALPFLPIYKNTTAMLSISLVHLVVYFQCRIVFFFRTAGNVLTRLESLPAWRTPVLYGCTALVIYHLALGVTLVRTALNGGHLPKPSAKFLEKQKMRQEWEALSQDQRDAIIKKQKDAEEAAAKGKVYARLQRRKVSK